MQLSIIAMSNLLRLACIIGAASAVAGAGAGAGGGAGAGAGAGGEGNSYQMLQPVVPPETTLTDAGVTARQVIHLALFDWTYNKAENVTHLMICATELLLVEGEEKKTNPTLSFMMDGNQINIEGVVDGNKSCSIFTQEDRVPLAKDAITYLLSLVVRNVENVTILKSGSVNFGMPVETFTISCNDKPYTRASGLSIDQTIQFDPPCYNDSLKLGNDVVCYLEGEFSSTTLCYTIKEPDLRVCLQGASQATVKEVDGLSISHLAYKRALLGPADEAVLSLEFDGQEPTGTMEALIWKEGMSFATSCLDTVCPIPHFTVGSSTYDVCAVALVDGVPVNTSTSSITDLNAGAVVYQDSPLLQFDYTNANEERFYIAYVLDKPDKNVTVDCSGVPLNSICHGFFQEVCTLDLKVAVEYADATMSPTGNKILFPCQQIDNRRR